MPPFCKGGLGPPGIARLQPRRTGKAKRAGGFFPGRSQSKYELVLRSSSLLNDLPYLLNNEHRRPSGFSPFQISVGLGSLGQGIRLTDFDFDRTSFNHLK